MPPVITMFLSSNTDISTTVYTIRAILTELIDPESGPRPAQPS